MGEQTYSLNCNRVKINLDKKRKEKRAMAQVLHLTWDRL